MSRLSRMREAIRFRPGFLALGLAILVGVGPLVAWAASPYAPGLDGRSMGWSARPVSSAPEDWALTPYGLDLLPWDGSGQTIAIIGAGNRVEGYADALRHDLAEMVRTLGLPTLNGVAGTPSCTVSDGPHPCLEIVGAPPAPRREPVAFTSAGEYAEMAADLVVAHKAAPGADLLLVVAASMEIHDLLEADRAAAASGAAVISRSFGVEERHLAADRSGRLGAGFLAQSEAVYRGSQGLFVAAAGDGRELIYPATSPHVLAVGGTSFMDRMGRFLPGRHEQAWGRGTAGTTGGFSALTEAPAHQAGLHSGRGRAVPDLAVTADGHNVFNLGKWGSFGGTSTAAPLMAGILARANQARAEAGLGPVREVAELYRAAGAPAGAAPPAGLGAGAAFRDITLGQGACGPACAARPGFDLATGLGAPRAEYLVPHLAGLAPLHPEEVRLGRRGLARRISFRLNREAVVQVCAGPLDRSRWDLSGSGPYHLCTASVRLGAGAHSLALPGLPPGRPHAVVVRVTDERGRAITSRPVAAY